MLRYDRDHAVKQDEYDPLKHLRREFIIPTKNDLNSKKLIQSCRMICFGFLNCRAVLLKSRSLQKCFLFINRQETDR
jgi:hypothetical protein